MAKTVNIPSQIVVQTAAAWAADATVYSEKRLLITSDAYYGATDQRKFKIADGVQAWSDLDYFPVSGYDDATSSIQTQINNITGGNVSFRRMSGYWYSSAITDFIPSTTSISRNVIRLTPFIVAQTESFDRIAMEIVSVGTAGSSVLLGIYQSNADGYPTTPLLTAGTILGDSATNQTIVISQTLNTGVYWLAYIHNSVANITFRTIQLTTGAIPGILGLTAGIFSTNQLNSIQMNYTYDGTFPTISGATSVGLNCAIVALRKI